MKSQGVLAALTACAASLVIFGEAHATRFLAVRTNTPHEVAPALSTPSFAVNVRYTFRVDGSLSPSLTGAFCDDARLLGIASMINAPIDTRSQPNADLRLPDGNPISRAFQSSTCLLAGANPKPSPDGEGPSERGVLSSRNANRPTYPDGLDATGTASPRTRVRSHP